VIVLDSVGCGAMPDAARFGAAVPPASPVHFADGWGPSGHRWPQEVDT